MKYKALRNFHLGDGRQNPIVKKDDVVEVDESFAKESLLPAGLVELADKKEVVTNDGSDPEALAAAKKAQEDEDEKSGKGKGGKGKGK